MALQRFATSRIPKVEREAVAGHAHLLVDADMVFLSIVIAEVSCAAMYTLSDLPPSGYDCECRSTLLVCPDQAAQARCRLFLVVFQEALS